MEADELRGALEDFDISVRDGDFTKLHELVNAVEEYEFYRGCKAVGAAVSRRTDRQKVEDLLNELGLGFRVGVPEPAESGRTGVRLEAGKGGPRQFFVEFVFDEKGGFRRMGVWE